MEIEKRRSYWAAIVIALLMFTLFAMCVPATQAQAKVVDSWSNGIWKTSTEPNGDSIKAGKTYKITASFTMPSNWKSNGHCQIYIGRPDVIDTDFAATSVSGSTVKSKETTYDGNGQLYAIQIAANRTITVSAEFKVNRACTDADEYPAVLQVAYYSSDYSYSATGYLYGYFTIQSPNQQAMYRLYNPNSGEHFYTANAAEAGNLVDAGWANEGIGWYAPLSSSAPVYRLYSGTDHHYTTSTSEKNSLVKAGWKYEGIGWYSASNTGQALYRQYNPNVNPKAKRNNSGSHNYTTSKAENAQLVKAGWHAEGIGWYGMK